MNLPNKLSVFRIMIVPFMCIIPIFITTGITLGGAINIPLEMLIFAILFIIGSLTDFLDGAIARKHNLVTDFGKFIDPLADKVLVLSAMMILVEKGILPSWIPIIVITREFAVSGYRLIEATNGSVVAASKLGKIKTMTQMLGIIFLSINPSRIFGFDLQIAYINGLNSISFFATINLIGSILIIISVIATIISGWDYLKHLKPILKDA